MTRDRETSVNDEPPRGEGADTQDLLDDRYELLELIGVGGVAEVWRARDRRLQRDVAVKILSGPAARDPSHRLRIEREARALAAITHPNVVGVYDYGEQPAASGEPVPYIVIELVNGPDLARHVRTSGPLDPQEGMRLMEGILAGVAQAHAIGIVHGDLKPANILLASDGPKVTDFGVARILAEETGNTALAATPTHAAPEVLRGERPTPASDLYSAACIAYELVAGSPPFEGTSFWDLSRQHLEADPLPLHEVRGDIPEPVDAAIRHGLAKDPAQRPQSAPEFAALLRGSVAGVGPTVPGPPAQQDGALPEQRDEGVPAATATVPISHHPTEVLPRPPEKRRVAGIATGLLRRIQAGPAIAVLAILLLILMHDTATATVRVPDMRGLSADDATTLASDLGFQAVTADVEVGGVAGTVVDHRPEPGALRTRGSIIELHVTTGAPQVIVPDVSGRPVEEARAELEAVGLTVQGVSFRADSEAPAGTVESTSPAAGESVDEGTAVTITAASPDPPPQAEPGRQQGPPPGQGRNGPPPGRGR